jgi:hypothetical protein
MSLIKQIQNSTKPLYFVFGGYNYSDEIKIKVEIKNKKININYITDALNHIKIKSKILNNNSKLLYDLDFYNYDHTIDKNKNIVIDCSMNEGYYKFPYCFCNYITKKIIIITSDPNNSNYYRLYEYIKFRSGFFTYNYSTPMIFRGC